MGSAAAHDSHDLSSFGYRPKLDRTLGSFSSFAAGFSYLSILTGMFQMFHVGFGSGGPAFFWTWPAVFAGQFLVALCFAELAAHYPLAGGVYQWSKHVGSGAVGWMAGWIYLASLVISISAVALALQVTLPQIDPVFQVIGAGRSSDAVDRSKNAVLLGCVLIAFTTLVNSVGVGLLAKINNLGVFAELVGAALLIVLLAVHSTRGPGVVFDTQGRGAGQPFGYLGAFLAAALMPASYVMYGFDTAGSLAEETNHPRRKAPRAILQALAAAAVAGALLMLFALMAVGDVHDGRVAQDDGGLPYIVTGVLGGELGKVFLCDVIFAITVCTLAVQTCTVRLMFAMARDNNLPFGSALARVSVTSRTPIVPAVVAGIVAAAILVVNVNIQGFIDLVAPIAILWANLAYLLVTLPLLYRRLKGWPARGDSPASRVFALGKWGILVNILAVAWGIFMIVNIGWPRPGDGPTAWYAQYGALLFTGGLVAIGGAYYGLVQRHKTGVLQEHRA
ncbi:MAG TPA: amino acid permease [Gemmataceae bacterium]|nr:amino acid permease [Gemmataceae bacterium]